jgi:hypothetical protein
VTFSQLLNAGVFERQAKIDGYNLSTIRLKAFAHYRSLAGSRGGVDGGATLAKERARLARAHAETAEFKNSIARGDFVSLKVIQDHLISLFSVIRERVLTLPGKVADGLTPHCDEDRSVITETLRSECHELLEGLSSGEFLSQDRTKKPMPGDTDDAESTAHDSSAH